MNAIGRVLVCALCGSAWAVAAPASGTSTVEIARSEDQFSRAHLEFARSDDRPGVAIVFEGTHDIHYYARSETAPAPGYDLRIVASTEGAAFDEPVYPAWQPFYDSSQQKNIEVYSGDFTVFVPLTSPPEHPVELTVKITGLACTSKLCLPPFQHTLTATLDPGTIASWKPILTSSPRAPAPSVADRVETARQSVLPYGVWVYYALAIAAGLSINIMPCVLPVIPLVLMRLIEQSKRSSGRLASGIAFCAGIVLFFLAFAALSFIVNVWTGTALDINSLFRYPAAVIVLFLAIVLFGLAMLDVVTPALPSRIAGRQGTGSGVVGSLGMGFFAALLSTPCSGALLGFVLVWAQTQPRLVSGTTFALMGVGMALPYAVLIAIPSLLGRIPKPGEWMDLFKKSTGFLLFFIAVKLTLAALPKDRLLDVLMYGVIFSFCVWMWGKWVGFSTPAARKWGVRSIAVIIAVLTGLWLLPARGLPKSESIDWQPYSTAAVQQARDRGQPVLLDFTADWCANCKVLDQRVYGSPDVAALIRQKNVLPIRADTTQFDYPATVDLKSIYGEAGNVPVTIVLPPGGQQEKIRGIFDKARLIGLLNEMPEVRR